MQGKQHLESCNLGLFWMGFSLTVLMDLGGITFGPKQAWTHDLTSKKKNRTHLKISLMDLRNKNQNRTSTTAIRLVMYVSNKMEQVAGFISSRLANWSYNFRVKFLCLDSVPLVRTARTWSMLRNSNGLHGLSIDSWSCGWKHIWASDGWESIRGNVVYRTYAEEHTQEVVLRSCSFFLYCFA